jgi:signal transduction histidine kinase
MKLRNRFILYFSPLIVAILGLGIFCVGTFSSIHNQFHNLQEDMTRNAVAMLELKKLLLSLETAIREKRINREQIAQKASKLKELITSHARYHTHDFINETADQGIHEMLHHAILGMTLSRYILDESQSGWPDAEFIQISAIIQQELQQLEAIIDQHLEQHLEQLHQTEIFITEKYQSTLGVVTVTSAGVIALAVLVFMLMIRSVLGPVQVLQEGTRQIAAGNLNHRLSINSGDEFEFLGKEFEKMAQQLALYHRDLDSKVQERTKELVRINTELKRAEEQVHNLSQKLLTVQETERQHISLYLHDNVAQYLSSLKIAGEGLFQDAAEGGSIGIQDIQDWTKLVDHCIKIVRELSYNLRPPSLEQIGLASAVAEYCRDFSKKTGLSVHFTRAGIDNLHLESDHAINVYRLVQEALNNVEKHALATRVEIRLIASHPHIILRIEDDGRGFVPEDAYMKAREHKRFGLLGMEERVRMMQGSFKLSSAPQQGTRILVQFPGPSLSSYETEEFEEPSEIG